MDKGDIGGANPPNVAGNKITIGFDVNGFYGSGNLRPGPMVKRSALAATQQPGHADRYLQQHTLHVLRPSNNLIRCPSPSSTYWNRVSLTMDFNINAYDLSMASCTGNTQLASNTWTVLQNFPIVTNAPFANNITSLNDMWWSVGTDPSGVGFQKNFFDHFTGRAIRPQPLAPPRALSPPRAS